MKTVLSNWREPRKTDLAAENSVSIGTRLLAASFYTRGLWSVVGGWRRLSAPPFRHRPIEWVTDRNFLNRHLRIAAIIASAFLILQVVYFWGFIRGSSQWVGFILVFSILVQWLVLPYFAVRAILLNPEVGSVPYPLTNGNQSVVLKDLDGTIKELGYLIREAVFSVDTQKGSDGKISEIVPKWDNPREDLFRSVQEAFRQSSCGIFLQRLSVRCVTDAQPEIGSWRSWRLPSDQLETFLGGEDKRLVVLGQASESDSFASMELCVRDVTPHICFRLQLRWLPGLKPRLRNLRLLCRQRMWWRGIAIPAGLLLAVFTQWLLIGNILLGMEPGSISNDRGILAQALFPNRVVDTESVPSNQLQTDEYLLQNETEEGAYNWETQEEFEYGSTPIGGSPAQILLGAIQAHGPMSPASWIAGAIAISPFFWMMGIGTARVIRYLRGCLYVATGTSIDVSPISSLRFNSAATTLNDDDGLLGDIAYLQIFEEVALNRIVEVLKGKGIDTSVIKEEIRAFINEGIYMTGGEIRASNVVVGRGGKLSTRKSKGARTGQRTLLSRKQN